MTSAVTCALLCLLLGHKGMLVAAGMHDGIASSFGGCAQGLPRAASIGSAKGVMIIVATLLEADMMEAPPRGLETPLGLWAWVLITARLVPAISRETDFGVPEARV